MTKKIALAIALSAITPNAQYPNPQYDGEKTTAQTFSGEEVRATLEKMIEQLSKTREVDEEKKAAMNAARKEKTVQARTELVAAVIPILREVLSKADNGMTAKELYATAKDNLPADFSAPKVQNILRREMAPELMVTEAKGKPNVYVLAMTE